MLKRISLFAILTIIIASCSGEDKAEPRDIEEYVSAIMKGNDKIIAFGSVSAKGIIDKTDYKSDRMLEAVISKEVNAINELLGIDSPVYFTAEGPIAKNGQPERVLLFIKVKNAEELATYLEQELTYLVEKSGDIQYAEDNEYVISFRNDLAIVIIKRGDYDAKKIVAEVFKKSEGKVSGGKVDEMLKAKGDMVMNLNLEHLYGTSNTDLNKLSADKQKELQKMSKGSYVQAVLKFDKGSMSLESKNYFSKELQDLMFFKSNASSDLSQKLAIGKGKVIGGMSMSVDVKKLEKFYSNYAPNMMDDFSSEEQEEMTGMVDVFKYIGAGNIMSALSNGQIGMLAIENRFDNENVVGIRSFFGSSVEGQKVFSLMRNEMKLPKDGEFNYVDGGIEGIVPLDGASIDLIKGDMKLKMPKGSENFGKKGLCAFINFNQMERKGMSMQESMIIKKLDYATLEVDNEGGKLFVKTKNGNENILKQAMSIVSSMLPMMMGGGMPF